MKSLDIMNARIKQRKEEHNKNLKTTVKNAEEAEKRLQVAKAAMDNCIRTGDTKKYSQAKNEYTEAETDKELFKNRIEFLEKNVIIEQDEYIELLEAVKNEMKPKIEEQQKKIKAILEDCLTETKDNLKAASTADDLILDWQHAFYGAYIPYRERLDTGTFKMIIDKLETLLQRL